MSGQPPPLYEEVVAESRALLEPSSALVVHLQVWHYRSEGRNPANNDGLAAPFRDHNLQAWEVVPFEADGITGPSSHDQYVPVEVSKTVPLAFAQFSIHSCVKSAEQLTFYIHRFDSAIGFGRITTQVSILWPTSGSFSSRLHRNSSISSSSESTALLITLTSFRSVSRRISSHGTHMDIT